MHTELSAMSQQESGRLSRQPLSVVIITKNAATQLGGCLDSASFADEIVVVDSDRTTAPPNSRRSAAHA